MSTCQRSRLEPRAVRTGVLASTDQALRKEQGDAHLDAAVDLYVETDRNVAEVAFRLDMARVYDPYPDVLGLAGLNNQASLSLACRQFSVSRQLFEEAVRKCDDADRQSLDFEYPALPMYNLAVCWALLGHGQQAHEHFKRAAAAVRELDKERPLACLFVLRKEDDTVSIVEVTGPVLSVEARTALEINPDELQRAAFASPLDAVDQSN